MADESDDTTAPEAVHSGTGGLADQGLPLWVATAHNAGAALLLFTVVGLLARLRAPE